MRLILPLFPLGAVLFPGGVLPLRVFETRYVDMVKNALRDGGVFGVVRIKRGSEIGRGAGVEIESVGCRARITTWDMKQLGVLTIETIGTERFRVLSHIVQEDQLLVADVETIAPDDEVGIPDDAALCSRLLERIVEQLRDKEGAADDDKPFRPIADPCRFDDAAWVGNRLAELLPVAPPTKQRLMEMTDPLERLAAVRRYLVEQGIA